MNYINVFLFDDRNMDSYLDKFAKVLKSQTYKESRARKNIKFVPNEVAEVNLRIHHQVRNIKPEAIDIIEKKLQNDYKGILEQIDNLKAQNKDQELSQFLQTKQDALQTTLKNMVRSTVITRQQTDLKDQNIHK